MFFYKITFFDILSVTLYTIYDKVYKNPAGKINFI